MEKTTMEKLKGKNRRRLQAGNAIIMLFAAIGMAGVVTYGLNNVIRGPAVTTAEVSRRTIAENNLVATTRLAISSATHQQVSDGDCDGDGFVEPLPYRDAGAGPHPVGGGYIPSTMGASMSDPWGNKYGYCVWDPGTVSVSDAMPACGGATPRRLQGAPRDDQYAIAVVSAGKNGVFETECRNYVDGNTDNIPDDIMLETDPGSDDIVLAYSYAEANGIGGGEWRVKDGTPGTAEIGKNIALGSASNPRGASFNDGLELGGTRGLILPRDPGDNSVTGTCDADKVNQLRLNIGDGSEVPLLEVCYNNAWTVVSGGTTVGGGTCNSLGPWTSAPSLPSWGHIHDVIYAGNQFVGVSSHSNIVATSPDGITWTERTVPDGEWYDIAYGNGIYVATGSGGTNRVITSPDGITWTARTPVEVSQWNDVAFGNGIFVAVAGDGTNRVMTSIDGITWTARTASEVASWGFVAYMGNQFVAGGGGGTENLMTSPDGINWTSVVNDAGGFNQMGYNGSDMYVFSGGSSIASSPDLATWTSIAAPAGMGNMIGGIYGGGLFLVAGFSGSPQIATSPDGLNWTTMPSPTGIWVGMTYGDDKFVVTGYNGEIMYAECQGATTPAPTDACTLGPWIDRDATTPDGLSSRDVAFGNGTFVSVGEGNAVMTSPDGITWTQRAGVAGGEWEGVAYGSGTWVAVGYGTPGIMSSSDNGVTWAARTEPENNAWQKVTYGNGYFVAVTDGGTNRVMRSADGITWTSHAASAGDIYWSDVFFADNQFVALRNGSNGPGDGPLMTSPDGATWTGIDPGYPGPVGYGTFGNNQIVSAQNNTYSLSTNGGTSWTDGSLPAGAGGIGNIGYAGGWYIATAWGGTDRLVKSEDGITWTVETPPVTGMYSGVAYGQDRIVVTAMDGALITSECAGGTSDEDESFAPPVMPHPLDAGMIAHWKLDEGTGSTAVDSIGSNDGTFVNTPQWTPRGPIGTSSLTFQHDDLDAVSIPGLLDQPANGTISLWANVAFVEANSAEFLSLGDNIALREHIDRGITLIVHVGGGTWDGIPTDVKIRGTGWHHIVGTWDQTEDMYRIYIDGILVGQKVIATPISWTRGMNTFIGRHGNVEPNYNMDGGLDDIRVYNRALSPLEVRQLYERTQGGSDIRLQSPTANINPVYGQLSISAEGSHACALRKDGSSWCWGRNTNGQLGAASTTTPYVSPVRVAQQGIHNFLQISAGRYHTCGVTSDSNGWCWGGDASQELGDGATALNMVQPVLVNGSHTWVMISAGDSFSCGIRQGGSAYCWGDDTNGRLGNGASGNQNAPFAVNSTAIFNSIDVGSTHACGIQSNGSALCWGAGGAGQLGNGGTSTQQSPVTVSGDVKWKDVSVEGTTSCGLSSQGTLYCWGTGYNTTPTMMFPGDTWTNIELGKNYICGLKADGSVWCGGVNTDGQLGNGAITGVQAYPTRVALPGPAVAIAASKDTTCAMEAQGTLWCWGDDTEGVAGNGATLTADQTSPSAVQGWPDVAPFVWSSSATSFQINGGMTIALGDNKWVSDDGSARYFGFESAGKARLRQTGSSNQLLVETQAAANSAQVSFMREASGAADYTTGLVAEWLFDEAAGSSTAASSVGTFPATITGAATFNTTGGRLATNGVLEFDGNSRATVLNHATLRPTTFTVSFWMRPDNQQERGATVLSKAHTNNSGTQEQTYGFEFDGAGNLLFATGITGAQDFLSSDVPVRINSWVHVVGIYDPAGVAPQKRLYINGALVGSKSQTTALVYDVTNAGNLFFGAAGCVGTCQGFSGAIDDVRIYNTALTTAQVDQLFRFQTSTVSLPRAIGIDHGTNNLEVIRQTSAGTEMASSVSPDLALTSTGTIAIGSTAVPAAPVDVNGGVRVGYESACTAAGEGAIRFTGNITDTGRPLSCTATGWLSSTAAGGLTYNSLAYGQGKFIAPDSAATGNYYTSANGVNWVAGSGMPASAWQGIAYGNNMWVAVGTGGALATSPDGNTWTARVSPNTNGILAWAGISYNNGAFIAVSSTAGANNIMRSTDGINWSLATIAGSNVWTRVTYGNGVWVAVGTNIAAYSTNNGLNWTVSAPPANSWSSVTFGNDVFVAVATGGQIMTSVNGINWTARTPSTGGLSLRSVNFGGGIFWTMGNSSTMMYSTNGTSWTSSSMPDSRIWIAGAYGAGRLVSIAQNSTATTRYAYSGCGTTVGEIPALPSGAVGYWKFDETTGTTAADSIGANPGTLAGNATFVAGRKGNAISLDGTDDYVNMGSAASLDDMTAITACAWVNISAGGGSFPLIVGKSQTNGLNGWNLYAENAVSSTTLMGFYTRSGAYKNYGGLLRVGEWHHLCGTWSGALGLSAVKAYLDGTEIAVAPSPSSPGGGLVSDAAYNLVVGATHAGGQDFSGLIDEVVIYNRVLAPSEISQLMSATSAGSTGSNTDYLCTGQNWTYQTSLNVVSSLTFGNGTFVAVGGYPEQVATSPDGVTWTYRSPAPGEGWFSDVTYGNGQFVAVSYNGPGRVMTSPDGINWTARTAAEANDWSGVTYGNGLYVAVAANGTNRVMTSPDGFTWTARAAPLREWTDIAYGNGIYMAISGSDDRRMTSPDGINWTEQPGTNGNGKVGFGDGIFLISSSGGVQSTTDGVAVTAQTTPSGDWYGMTYDAVSDLWIVVSYQNPNRIMTSPDGVTWTAQSSPVAANFNHVAVGNGVIVALANNGPVITSTCPPAGKFQYCNGTTWRDTYDPATAPLSWKRRPDNFSSGGNWMGGIGAMCGVLSNGEARCWGRADNGGIGDGRTSPDAQHPVMVQTTTGPGGWSDWVKITASSEYSCGIRADGTAWCWGNGDGGELGNGTTGSSTRPVMVQTDTGPGGWTDWTDISAGNEMVCGLRGNGTAWCWGLNWYGALGNDASFMSVQSRPVQVDTDTSSPGWNDWIQIEAGMVHACGIRANGTAWCWGENRYGALGNNTVPGSEWGNVSTRPTQVVNDAGGAGWSDWVQIEANEHTCGRRSNGTIWCWGVHGGGLTLWSNTGRPAQVPNSAGGAGWTDWTHLTAGGNGGGCGIRANGTAWCWGLNSQGSLGDGTTDDSGEPVQVLNDTGGTGWNDWVSITLGQSSTTCGVRADASGWCWGQNQNYQVGDGTNIDRLLPTRITP